MVYTVSHFSWVIIPAVFAGVVQGVTGFGFGMLIMLFLPIAFELSQAAAISQCLSIVICGSMLYQYRKEVNGKQIILPLLFYFPCFFVSLTFSSGIDASFLKPALGIFLMLMSIYMVLFSGKISIKAGVLSAFICAAIASVGDAVFAIGGPPMVIYFLATTKGKKEYLGTIQAFSVACCIYGVSVRFMKGQLSVSMVPLLIAGILAQQIGLFVGGRLVDRMDVAMMKRLVYGFIGVAGVITFVMNI